MRKHFLILMLLALLPLAGWSAETLDYSTWTVTLSSTYSTYDGTPKTKPTITLTKQGADPVTVTNGDEGWVVAWDTEDWTNAGTKTVTVTNTEDYITAPTANTATYTIVKKQVVYFLTGGTYAVGDEPDITRHYSLANPTGAFVEGEELSDYASFDWADKGNDKLELENGRFTTKATYNIKALKVVPNPGKNQNYDFRFTSTAVIVVTGKSIAGFVAAPVAAQQYTGEQITPDAVAIYATAADRDAAEPIALDPSNYEVTYGDNINVGTTSGKIIYEGKGNYEGILEVPFAITKRELVKVTVAGFDSPFSYTHGEIEPTLTVTGEDEDGKPYELAATDYEVNYNGSNINVSDEGATGTLTEAAGGNFAFPENPEDVDDATFMIAPKDLSKGGISLAQFGVYAGVEDNDVNAIYYNDPAYTTEDGTNRPTTTVKWTIAENVEFNITEFVKWDYLQNENAGTATIIAKALEEGDEGYSPNYVGEFSTTFQILPTSIDQEGIQITLKKWNADAEEYTTDAEYKYEGRPITPGIGKDEYDILVDGAVIVRDGETLLKEGKDYEIVAYTDAAYAVYDNVNANDNAAVIIKGKGNYGKIDALANAITKTKTFEIGKKTLELSAVGGRSTTYGVSPIDPVVKFDYTDNTDEDAKNAAELLGGYVTYNLYSYDPTQEEPDYVLVSVENYTTLGISGEHLAYVYKPVWNNLPDVAPIVEQNQPEPVAGVDYKSEAQIEARLNYDLDVELSVIDTKSAVFTVNAAKWIIVPNNQEKKYGVDDAALTFSYKVYNGEKGEANLVDPAEVEFDEEVEPIFGRTPENHGEDVVNGGYTISILNEANVSKVGYTLEYETATLDILAFPITVKANNQSIYYGEDANLEHSETSKVKDVEGDEYGFGNLLTVEISPAMYGNQTLINREVLGLTLKYAKDYDGKAGPHKGALVPEINNTNFAATIVNGDLDVVAAGDLLLSETDDDLAGKIAAANDGDDKVITFDDITMLEKEWYAMVLPFETTPLELSTKLNTYVVVNVLKNSKIEYDPVDQRDEAIVNFGLEMDIIPAGVPFLIKPAKAVNWKDADAFTATVTEVITPAESPKATFSATYSKGKSIKWGLDWKTGDTNADMKYRWLSHSTDGNRSNGEPYGNAWWNCKSNAHNLVPMEAFLILDPAAQGARIFVEDFENGTTAIQSLNADEINGLKVAEGWYTIDGIKLQSMPTEKGVYINNGKKVVIK